MGNQVITRFVDATTWRFDLYNAVYGSAAAGSLELQKAVTYPNAELRNRVKIDAPYIYEMGIKLVAVNDAWQRAVGRLSGSRVIPDERIHSMLSCPLPYVCTSGNRSYPCNNLFCPNCYYRRLVRMYSNFAHVTEPGMCLCEHKLVSYNPDTRTCSNSLVGANSEILTGLNRQRKLPWKCGMSLTMPEWVPANKDHDYRWQCVTRTLALVDADTKFKDSKELLRLVRPVSNNRHNEYYTHLGEATPYNILDLLSTSFRYPAALLYESTQGIDLYELYAAFKGEGANSTARARTYGKIKQTLKGQIDVDNEQCVSWRPAFEAADLDESPGDKERRLRFIGADHRVLRFA